MERPGYHSREYALAIASGRNIVSLDHSGSWWIVHPVYNHDCFDYIPPYPLRFCADWALLKADVENLHQIDGLVSLYFTTDPFGNWTVEGLRDCFPDVCRLFKEHFVIDLSLEKDAHICKHHKRCISKSSGLVDVEVSSEPTTKLAKWLNLYDNLRQRHSIKGVTDFSIESLALQLQVPGIVAFIAGISREMVGMVLFYVMGRVAYYHLGAYSDQGYETSASYSIFNCAIDYFKANGLDWISLGAGGGMEKRDDGLTRFKSGWATGTKPVYFCGKVIDANIYRRLPQETGPSYFPAYRNQPYVLS